MSSRLIPSIFSSKKKLILSESICFLTQEGVEINIPTGNSPSEIKNIIIRFNFQKDASNKPSIAMTVSGFVLTVTLVNFNNVLGTGTTSPLNFKIGNDDFQILLYTKGLVNQEDSNFQLSVMTISIYSCST